MNSKPNESLDVIYWNSVHFNPVKVIFMTDDIIHVSAKDMLVRG